MILSMCIITVLSSGLAMRFKLVASCRQQLRMKFRCFAMLITEPLRLSLSGLASGTVHFRTTPKTSSTGNLTQSGGRTAKSVGRSFKA